jgi:hypothetical protein
MAIWCIWCIWCIPPTFFLRSITLFLALICLIFSSISITLTFCKEMVDINTNYKGYINLLHTQPPAATTQL